MRFESLGRGAWGVVLSATVAVAASPRALAGQDETIGIPHGATPPAVQIEDLDGQPVDLGAYIGKRPVLIEFWAEWCPLCEGLEPELKAAHAKYGERVEFLAIAVAVNQSKKSIKRHLEKHLLPLTFLWDTKGRAVRAFQAPSTSYVVILDASGKVVYTGLGEDQDLVRALDRAVAGGNGR